MKESIFISYSDYDKDKVILVKKVLENNTHFCPLIIASEREALRPLVGKVSEGIKKATYFVPIITQRSISTQWINQEIGYAFSMERKIIPIVEKEIIERLRGFIHKEVDLPYSFHSFPNRAMENKNFISCFRLLITDLEINFRPEPIVSKVKTEFEKSLDKVDELNKELDFQNRKRQYLGSRESAIQATQEVNKIISEIINRTNAYATKNFHFAYEKTSNVVIIKSSGYSFSIVWEPQYFDSIINAFLYVKYWKGHAINKRDSVYFPGDEANIINHRKFSFDMSRDEQPCWLNTNDNTQCSSQQILDSCFAWIIEMVSQKKII
jgi:hypothetical protein